MSVYKKISDDCRTFESDSDFLKFYEKNKETIDEINTRALNLKYKINGFRIGRKEGKIILYPINNVVSKVNTDEDSNVTLKQEVEELKLRINVIENILNNIIDSMNLQLTRMNELEKPKQNKPSLSHQNNQQQSIPVQQKYKWEF